MSCRAIVRVNMAFDPLRIEVDIIKEIVLLGNSFDSLLFFAIATWYVVDDSGIIFDQASQFSWT